MYILKPHPNWLKANGSLELLRLLRRHDKWATRIDTFLQRNVLKLVEPVLQSEEGRRELWQGVGAMALLATEDPTLCTGVTDAFQVSTDI